MKYLLKALSLVSLLTLPLLSAADDEIDKALDAMMRAELRTKGPATLERAVVRDEVQLAEKLAVQLQERFRQRNWQQ
jgi:hypothetical protein